MNTAGFLATTNDIKNADVMAGWRGDTISTSPAGPMPRSSTREDHRIERGLCRAGRARRAQFRAITATLGTVALASGNSFTLDI